MLLEFCAYILPLAICQNMKIITPKYYLYHKQRFDLSEKALKTVLGTEWKVLKKQATIEELQEFERIVYLSRNTRLLQNRKRK